MIRIILPLLALLALPVQAQLITRMQLVPISNIMQRVLMATNASFTNLNATTTLTNLATFEVPAHRLTNSGDAILALWSGKTMDSVENSNQIRITYGSETVLDTGLQPLSNSVFRAECRVVRTGGTSQHVDARIEWGLSSGAPFSVTNVNIEIGQTNGLTNVLAILGASTREGGITNNGLRIFFEPAPQ